MPKSPKIPPLIEEDDAILEWGSEVAPTIIDDVPEPFIEPETAPHDLTELAAASIWTDEEKRDLDRRFRAVYAAGLDEMVSVFRSIFLERGLTNDETAHLILLARQRSRPL